MKRVAAIYLVCIFLFHANGISQLAGTKNIPGDYATLAAAVADLNAQGVGSGGVTFNIASGYTETITSRINLTATGTSVRQIIFRRSGVGVNPRIVAYAGTKTPGTAVPDGIWSLVGSDYVTIDGIDLVDEATSNPGTMEYGIGLFKTSGINGAQNNTVMNCVITLNRVNNANGTIPMVDGSVGILVINSTPTSATASITVTSASGSNSFNRFYSNTIQNCNYGIALSGFDASTPFTLGDTNNDIGGNLLTTGNAILNFGGGGTSNPAAGIRANNQWGINISFNTINNNNGGGVNHETTLRGIYAQAGTGANATINNNVVSLKSAATTSDDVGIDNGIGSGGVSNTVDINNNTIRDCSYLTATTGEFTGIKNSAATATVNINSNTFANIELSGQRSHVMLETGSPSIAISNSNKFTNITAAGLSGNVRVLKTIGANSWTCNDNTIDGVRFTNPASTGSIDGVYNGASGAPSTTVMNNVIRNISVATSGTATGIRDLGATTKTLQNNRIYDFGVTPGSTGGATLIGVSSGGSANISGNQIYSLKANGASGGYVEGIHLNGGNFVSISKNRISDLSCLYGGMVSGIYIGLVAQTTNIYNNLIGDLRSPNADGIDVLRGIAVTSTSSSTTLNISFNTIYLNATSSGATFGTSGIFCASSGTATSATLNLRSNIVVNTSVANGTGLTVALRRSNTTLTNYGSVSNNNLFYAGTPGANNLIFSNGTNADQTLAEFKTRVGPREAASVTESPNFISTIGSDLTFLHIDTHLVTQIENGGIPVAGIADDFDGDSRNVSTPDIGADEFVLVSDAGAPVVTDVCIVNATLNTDEDSNGSDDYVKNGDNVTITATVTDDNALAASNIVADLSGLYGGVGHTADNPITYELGVATWAVPGIVTNPANSTISVSVTATDLVFNSTTAIDNITSDNALPTAPTNFKAFTNPAGGHGKVNLTWTAGTDDHYRGVEVRYNIWQYPTYAFGLDPMYPDTRDEGTVLGSLPLQGTSAVHEIVPRGIYEYTVFCVDWAGNYSIEAGTDQQDRSANYFPGDIGSGAGVNPPGEDGYDGRVDFDDLFWFSSLYGTSSSAWSETNRGAEIDFGPTISNKSYAANHRFGIPRPDGFIDFEDLMIFSMNYLNTTPKVAEPGDRQLVRQFAVELMKGRSTTSQGEMLSVTVRVANDGREIKGIAAALNFNPSELQFVDATSGGLFGSQQQGFVFAKAENNKVQIDAAVLGIDRTINFSGNLAVVRFRVLHAGQGDVSIDNAVVRSGSNSEQIPVLNNNAVALPTSFSLTQNYPNPFNPTTRIDYQVPATSPVTVEVFNVLGEKVATLVNEVKEAGYYNVVWNGKNMANQQVASGLYIYTMRAGEFKTVRKMLVLK